MKYLKQTKAIISCVAALYFIIFSTGCAAFGSRTAVAKTSAAAYKESKKEPLAVYRDFGDVLIPRGFKEDKKNSLVFDSQGTVVGVLKFKGGGSADYLKSFFESNMDKDNWHQLSFFKSGRTRILFKKVDRYCVINIEEGFFSTSLEIWVTPTTGDSLTIK